jgi:hypothetical protein
MSRCHTSLDVFLKKIVFFFIITGIAPIAVKVDGLPSLLQ